MWNTAREFERAAERAAADRARRSVLHAIGYEAYVEPPPAPSFGDQLHYLFFSSVVPFFIWIIKACFLAIFVLILSVGTYGAIWSFIMRGLEVHHRPIFFDYSPGEPMMPVGVVDLRSTKSAPWVHSCGEGLDNYQASADDITINDGKISYRSGEGEDSCHATEHDQATNAILPSDEKHFFEITLTLPESEINKKLGVFMVKVDLRSSDRSLLASSKQHSMLPYESTMVSLSRKALLILPLISGLLSETRTITLLCFDSYVDVDEKRPASLVEVSLGVPNPAAFPATLQTIQIHSAELRYGKEMNAAQSFFRNWRSSCAFFGTMVFFIGYGFIALIILNRRARKNRWNTQPYANFFDSINGSSAQNNGSASCDRWMGADIEILEDDEDDDGAWEPIDSTNKEEQPDELLNPMRAATTNNLVSDEESFSSKQNIPGKNESMSFPLGNLANNSVVKGHEHLFGTKSNGDRKEHRNQTLDEDMKCKNRTDHKLKSNQKKEEKYLADMVMKGRSKLDLFTDNVDNDTANLKTSQIN
mmetsp:Transcript_24773/g.52552  ORF Transcript_24773/g.52552 Transcript_24773/m.52552 type:complete len:532 (+) Transcript_24773:86-1681(+)